MYNMHVCIYMSCLCQDTCRSGQGRLGVKTCSRITFVHICSHTVCVLMIELIGQASESPSMTSAGINKKIGRMMGERSSTTD